MEESKKCHYIFEPYNSFEKINGEDIVRYGFGFIDTLNTFSLEDLSKIEEEDMEYIEVQVVKDHIRRVYKK